jgi:hypothetical protein
MKIEAARESRSFARVLSSAFSLLASLCLCGSIIRAPREIVS